MRRSSFVLVVAALAFSAGISSFAQTKPAPGFADYGKFEFHLVAQRLQTFCSEDLGGFWLDILKDRLYTAARGSRARRSVSYPSTPPRLPTR